MTLIFKEVEPEEDDFAFHTQHEIRIRTIDGIESMGINTAYLINLIRRSKEINFGGITLKRQE